MHPYNRLPNAVQTMLSVWLVECLSDLAERSADLSGSYNRAYCTYPPTSVDRHGYYCRSIERYLRNKIYTRCRELQDSHAITKIPRYRVSVQFINTHVAEVTVNLGQLSHQQKITPHPDIVWSTFFKSIGAHNG